MKKWKMILALLIIVGIVSVNCSVAEAAENEMVVVPVGRTMELISDEELPELSMGEIGGSTGELMGTNASYSVYRYTDTFEFYLNGQWVAEADAEAIVWHYTDGKVHLYQRTISVSRLPDYDAARIYGSIVNTDGSYSYTTGDRVHIFGDMATWVYAIDFYVSDTEAYFTCYQV